MKTVKTLATALLIALGLALIIAGLHFGSTPPCQHNPPSFLAGTIYDCSTRH